MCQKLEKPLFLGRGICLIVSSLFEILYFGKITTEVICVLFSISHQQAKMSFCPTVGEVEFDCSIKEHIYILFPNNFWPANLASINDSNQNQLLQ
jgi:hypothetical protein